MSTVEDPCHCSARGVIPTTDSTFVSPGLGVQHMITASLLQNTTVNIIKWWIMNMVLHKVLFTNILSVNRTVNTGFFNIYWSCVHRYFHTSVHMVEKSVFQKVIHIPLHPNHKGWHLKRQIPKFSELKSLKA